MKQNKLVKVTLHGDLGNKLPKTWDLAVSSVKDAINAINSLLDNQFNMYFVNNNKLTARYRILINNKDFYSPASEINQDNYDIVHRSELVMKKKDLETIDIVPFIESSNSKFLGGITTILGIALIVVGALTTNASVILAGIGLLASGTMALLIRPPEFPNSGNISKSGGQSYLFSGPLNVVGEGGPVPVGYGRVLVGSQVISSTYSIQDFQTFRSSNPV